MRGVDPGRLDTIDLSHSTDGGDRLFNIILFAGIAIAIAIASLAAAVFFGPPPPKPHCPDGYSLAGGGFAGALRCEAGPPVEWR